MRNQTGRGGRQVTQPRIRPPPQARRIMTLHDRPVEEVPGTPPELMALLRAGLSPDPAARPQSAAALREALADPRGHVAAAPPAPVRPAGAPAWDRQEGTPTWNGQESTPTWNGQGSTPTWDRQESAPRRDDRPAMSARHRQASPSGRGAMPAGAAGRPEAPARARSWQSPGRLGLAAGLMMILVAALVAASRFLPHGASPGTGTGGTSAGTRPGGAVNAADVFGIATRSAGCPAAALRVSPARCPATPECFAGLTVISGAASAAPLSCDQPHYWQTFAIAILPADVRTFEQPMVAADATVRKVCSERVMLASRHGLARRLRPGTGTSRSCRPPRPRSTAARTSTAASPTKSGTSRAHRSSAGSGGTSAVPRSLSQVEAGADRARDEGGGEPGRHRVLGAPAGAVGGHEHAGVQRG